jgi:hypothetical protein
MEEIGRLEPGHHRTDGVLDWNARPTPPQSEMAARLRQSLDQPRHARRCERQEPLSQPVASVGPVRCPEYQSHYPAELKQSEVSRMAG